MKNFTQGKKKKTKQKLKKKEKKSEIKLNDVKWPKKLGLKTIAWKKFGKKANKSFVNSSL